MLIKNPEGKLPDISKTAYISKSAVITGNVIIGEKVFVAPNVSIRADEAGSSIVIKDECNIQDNVIIHALTGTKVIVGHNTSLSHGCIVHGPLEVGKKCFIGFGSVLFNCSIGDKCFISHLALVKNVRISDNKIVDDGAVINNQKDAECLLEITKESCDFANQVINANLILVNSYPKNNI